MDKIGIIGSGPAGLSASIYAARSFLHPIVFSPSGGQLEMSSEVGNYPGFREMLTGPELIKRMREQSEFYGTKFIPSLIEKVDFSANPYKLFTSDGKYEFESVIIASGSSARWLNIPGEGKHKGKGVSSCATCDGFFFKNKIVVVVGGGDAASEEALFLTKFASKVYIVHRRDQLRASKILQDRVLSNIKIKVIWDTEVKEVLGEDRVESLKMVNNRTGKESSLKTDGMFVAIGHNPNTYFLKGQIELDKKGYIKVRNNVFTSVGGVFAAGDVADWKYQQAVVAAGFGVIAELEAEKWLIEKN